MLEVNARFRRLEEARAQLRAARDRPGRGARERPRAGSLSTRRRRALLTDVLQTQSSLADTRQPVSAGAASPSGPRARISSKRLERK